VPASPRSKLRLVRARLVLSEYLTFSLQGFRQLGEPLMPPWIEIYFRVHAFESLEKQTSRITDLRGVATDSCFNS